jgi:hypothetical protein
MKYLAEIQLETGGSVLLEVDAPAEQGHAVDVARLDQLAERAHDTLEAAIDKITPAALSVMQRIRNLAIKPDEISLQFGVKISAEAGAFIASAASEANFQVALKWTKATPSKPGDATAAGETTDAT